jgi:hypothetical protein
LLKFDLLLINRLLGCRSHVFTLVLEFRFLAANPKARARTVARDY